MIKYSPDQSRVPAGRPDGQQIRIAELKLRKASADDPEHPGWPAGTPEDQGGKFRPKDSENADNENRAGAGRQPPIIVAARSKRNQAECDEQLRLDEFICRSVRTPLCWAQAMERYAACLAGRPIPPLNF